MKSFKLSEDGLQEQSDGFSGTSHYLGRDSEELRLVEAIPTSLWEVVVSREDISLNNGHASLPFDMSEVKVS